MNSTRNLIDHELIPAIEYVHKFLSMPFDRKGFYERLVKSSLNIDVDIPRPNHGMPHSMRVAAYVLVVMEFLRKHGKVDHAFIIELQNLDVADMFYLQIAALFSVVGRKDETGFGTRPTLEKTEFDIKSIYRGYREASANAYIEYEIKNCDKETCEKSILGSVVREMGNIPFYLNAEQSEMDAKIFKKPNRLPNVRDLILHVAHCLDLVRCSTLTNTPEKNPFLILDGFVNKNNADYQHDYIELLQFAVTLNLVTGNALVTVVDENGNFKSADDGLRKYRKPFLECNKDIGQCLLLIQSVNVPSFYEQGNIDFSVKPIAHYLSDIELPETTRVFSFTFEQEAETCLLQIKSLLVDNDPSIQSVFVSQNNIDKLNSCYFIKLTKSQFELLEDFYALRATVRSKARSLIPTDDFYFKSVRADETGYLKEFTHQLIDTSYRQEKRKTIKKYVKCDGHGINIRVDFIGDSYKKNTNKHTAEQKKYFTKSQPASLSFNECYSPVFGIDNKEALVTFHFGKNNVLLTDYLSTCDRGTFWRKSDFYSISEAEKFVADTKNIGLFSEDNIDGFKKALLAKEKKDKHNEVLARLRWTCDDKNNLNSNKIAISKDNLASRLLAKAYAEQFEDELYKAGKLPQGYKIPIIYYLPDNEYLNFKEYTQQEYEIDCLQAFGHFNLGETYRWALYENKRYEFLLGLSPSRVSEVLLSDFTNTGFRLASDMLNQGYVQIFMLLHKKSGLPLHAIFGKEFTKITPYLYSYQERMMNILYHVLMNDADYIADYLLEHVDFSAFTYSQQADENSPLMAAIDRNNVPWAERLLQWKMFSFKPKHQVLGADIIVLAFYFQRLEIIDLMLKYKVFSFDGANNTPKISADAAVRYSKLEIINYLIFNGIDIHYQCNNKSPVELSLELERYDVFNAFLRFDSKIATRYPQLLVIAVNRGHLPTIINLIRADASLSVNGKHVIEIAYNNDRFDIVKLIAESKQSTIYNRKYYNQALLQAAQAKQYDCVAALLYAGAESSYIKTRLFAQQIVDMCFHLKKQYNYGYKINLDVFKKVSKISLFNTAFIVMQGCIQGKFVGHLDSLIIFYILDKMIRQSCPVSEIKQGNIENLYNSIYKTYANRFFLVNKKMMIKSGIKSDGTLILENQLEAMNLSKKQNSLQIKNIKSYFDAYVKSGDFHEVDRLAIDRIQRYHLIPPSAIHKSMRDYEERKSNYRKIDIAIKQLNEEIKQQGMNIDAECIRKRAILYQQKEMINEALMDYLQYFDMKKLTSQLKQQELGEVMKQLFCNIRNTYKLDGIDRESLFKLIQTLQPEAQIDILGYCLKENSVLNFYLKKPLPGMFANWFNPSSDIIERMQKHRNGLMQKPCSVSRLEYM